MLILADKYVLGHVHIPFFPKTLMRPNLSCFQLSPFLKVIALKIADDDQPRLPVSPDYTLRSPTSLFCVKHIVTFMNNSDKHNTRNKNK